MTNQDLNHAFAYDHDCLRLSGPNKKIHHICHQNMSHNVIWGWEKMSYLTFFSKKPLLLFTRPLHCFLYKMQKQQALCDTTYLSTYDNSSYISAAAFPSDYTVPSHTRHRTRGCDINYSKSRELFQTWCTAVCRACAELYVEAALSSYHQMLGMETKGCRDRQRLHGAAEVADRVSSWAGLVNLDIINTPLAAFLLHEQRNTGKTAHGIHMLMCNNLSMTLGWKQCSGFIYMAKASLLFWCKMWRTHAQGVRKFTASEEHRAETMTEQWITLSSGD